jgi:hypothetical protein
MGRGSGKMSTDRECGSRKTVWLPSLALAAAGDIGLALQVSGSAPWFGARSAPLEVMPR